jgi:glutamyl-tRNA reductase
VTIVFLGTDFQDSSFRTLERLEAVAPVVREKLATAGNLIEGSLVVATCNRFELYLDTDNTSEALATSVAFIAEQLGEPVAETSKLFRVRHDTSALLQLFHVAAGLESMVVGEGEIVSQLRNSLGWSRDLGVLSAPLQRAVDRAFRVSKRVTQEYGLADSGRSVIDTSLDMARSQIVDLESASVVVCGTGAYARVVLAALRRRGVSRVRVYSRSGRGKDFATSHGVECIPADGLVRAVMDSDLVVSASGAPGYVLSWEMLDGVPTPPKPIVFIDVALSRDIDPRLEYAGFGSIITLESIRREVPREHSTRISDAERSVHSEVLDFVAEDDSRSLDDVVASLRALVSEAIEDEVRAVGNRLGDEVAREIQRSLTRVANQLLHLPSVRARSLAKEGLHEDYRRAIDVVFGTEIQRHA